ncbi:hypothetical protein M404DRAFT_520504 [Pisolithus tinctorius Marx 270]|uniref:Uncharacterized protein n=1 Tax=Pisolithus tinctorius Marx 270 TaxID=870435 RepID=A0A0C3PC77_PISTI|nr:hypothetical protein M404DRAFT_520504 [Pisolithus tinctorius Marx 270]
MTILSLKLRKMTYNQTRMKTRQYARSGLWRGSLPWGVFASVSTLLLQPCHLLLQDILFRSKRTVRVRMLPFLFRYRLPNVPHPYVGHLPPSTSSQSKVASGHLKRVSKWKRRRVSPGKCSTRIRTSTLEKREYLLPPYHLHVAWLQRRHPSMRYLGLLLVRPPRVRQFQESLRLC